MTEFHELEHRGRTVSHSVMGREGSWTGFRLGLLLCVLAVILGACGFLRESLREEMRIQRESPYRKVYEDWTRTGRAYTGFSVEMIVHATLLGPTFRDALLEKRSADYGWTEAEIARWKHHAREEVRRTLEFMLFAYAPERKRAELGTDRSVWNLYLENAKGARLLPLDVERLSDDPEVLVRDYPRATPWCIAYRIRFRADDGMQEAEFISEKGQPVFLNIMGPLGAVRMEWRYEEAWPVGCIGDSSG